MVNIKLKHSISISSGNISSDSSGSDCECSYVDLSVAPCPGRGDDETYLKHPELLGLVPRGLVYLQEMITTVSTTVNSGSHMKKNDKGHERWSCVLRGLTKVCHLSVLYLYIHYLYLYICNYSSITNVHNHGFILLYII